MNPRAAELRSAMIQLNREIGFLKDAGHDASALRERRIKIARAYHAARYG